MLRKSKKSLAILLTLAMLAMMFVSVPIASAAGTLTPLSVPTVIDNPNIGQALGTVKVVIPGGSIKNGASVIFKLPGDFDFNTAFATAAPVVAPFDGQAFTDATDPGVGNRVVVPALLSADPTDVNGLTAANIDISILDANDEIQLKANAAQSLVQDFVFYVYFDDIKVEDGTDKECEVIFDGPANTGFATGTVTIGRSASAGGITLTVNGADTSNNNFNFDLRIKEDTAGSLELGNETIEITLPDGYEWTTGNAANVVLAALWGEPIVIDINVDDDELTIDFNGVDVNNNGIADAAEIAAATARDTNIASSWELTGLAFTVADEADCKPGDFNAKFDGESTINTNQLTVGTYGEFGVEVSAKSVPEIFAGQEEQEIGDIVITEHLMETLVIGRTVTLTLPTGARWQQEYVADVTGAANPGNLPNFDRDHSLALNFVTYTGTDNRTARFTVANDSTDAAVIDLEDVEVAIEAGFTGDLVVTVGGSAGINEEVVVAKVVAPVSATAASAPDVVIGLGGQAAGDFTVTENVAGAFIEDGTVALDLPGGVVWNGTPTVEVTSGDLKIENVRRGAGDNQIWFDINRDSTEASTIKVSNANLKLDRTVAEGNITMKVQGTGVVETQNYSDWTNSDTAASAVIARVTTPAPGDVTATATFTIGSTTYTVNGAEQTMDVAPYIKDSRTYMPLRYVAMSLGVTEQNMMWDDAAKSATLIKGDKVVQVKIGSTQMLVNGIAINMDVAPEISSDRTMLPLRWIGQAFGANFTWDDATQTATMKL